MKSQWFSEYNFVQGLLAHAYVPFYFWFDVKVRHCVINGNGCEKDSNSKQVHFGFSEYH